MSVISTHATLEYLRELFPHYQVYSGTEEDKNVVYVTSLADRFMAVVRSDSQLPMIVRTVSKW